MPLESCTEAHGASKSSRDPKTVDYSPRKRPEMREITCFEDAARVVYRGSRGIEIPPGNQKPSTIAHENGQKCSKSRVMTMPLESCTEGHGASKSSWDLKTVDIAHENGQKCTKSRVLTMPLESCTGGHGASKSPWEPKTVDYSPRKRSEMLEITSFDDAARIVYRGSRGIEILPGPENRGL